MNTQNLKFKAILKDVFPTKTWVRLLMVWLMVILFKTVGNHYWGSALSNSIAIIGFIILLSTILLASFGAIKEADLLAKKLGEPYGTLILTLSIVSIEVILIAAVLLGPGENATIGRDSIFSVMMIIINLVMGICIIAGNIKNGPQEYNVLGTHSYLGMMLVLGGMSLILPNYIYPEEKGVLGSMQGLFISIIVLTVYVIFLVLQLKKQRYLYIQPEQGNMEVKNMSKVNLNKVEGFDDNLKKFQSILWIRFFILLLMIVPIVILAHDLAIIVDHGISTLHLPAMIGGVLIAIIVFTPESMAALKAVRNNEMQRTINLCHGAFVSTVGLTIPTILLIGLIMDKTILLGLTESEVWLWIITLLLSCFTFSGRKTNLMLGILHLVVFILFIIVIFSP